VIPAGSAVGPTSDPDRAAQRWRRRRPPPLQHQGRAFDALRRQHQLLAEGVEAQPFRQPVEQRGAAKRRLERGEPAPDRRLAQPERAAGRAQRAVARDREKHAGIVPIHRGRAVGIGHDTKTYRGSPILSIFEIIMCRYDRNRQSCRLRSSERRNR
jgi:hypothetical protein